MIEQSGPAIVDLLTWPEDGARVEGELCVDDFASPLTGFSLTVGSDAAGELAEWRPPSHLLARLRRCHVIELPPLIGDGPFRIRLSATGEETGRWQGLSVHPTERHKPPAPAGAERAAKPLPRLVLFYVMDALRADGLDHLRQSSLWGGLELPSPVSPTIDQLAREGHTFLEHRSTAPNTLLSIRHLFSGSFANDSRRAEEDNRPLLAELFRRAGYLTGLFSGNGYLSERFGLVRGFDHVSQEALFRGTVEDETAVNRNAERVHDAASRWLRQIGDTQPVFLYVQTIHPHNPYAPPPSLEQRFANDIPSQIRGSTRVLTSIQRGRFIPNAADQERLRALYFASIAYNDAQLAHFLRTLREYYEEDEILLLLTSDHGEELFDHGGVLHGYTLYEEQLRIPLVVWSPGRVLPQGETSTATDSLDLYATLAELLDSSANASAEAESLFAVLFGRTNGRSFPAAKPRLRYSASEGIPGGLFAVRYDRWKMMWARGTPAHWSIGLGRARSWDREYFFDLAVDPQERINRAGEGSVIEQWLKIKLRRWVAAQRTGMAASREQEHQEPPDREERERLRALGYLD